MARSSKIVPVGRDMPDAERAEKAKARCQTQEWLYDKDASEEKERV